MKAFFRFDCEDSPAFAGIDTGRLWNGWACPMIEAHNVAILAAYLEGAIVATADGYAVTDDGEVYPLPKIEKDGRAYFDFSGFGFCFLSCDEAGNFISEE